MEMRFDMAPKLLKFLNNVSLYLNADLVPEAEELQMDVKLKSTRV